MATAEQEAMRRAVEDEFMPLGVSVVRCASIADRLLGALAEDDWRLVPTGTEDPVEWSALQVERARNQLDQVVSRLRGAWWEQAGGGGSGE